MIRLAAFLLFTAPFCAIAQTTPLGFSSSAIKLCVAEDNTLFAVTRVGEFAWSRSIHTTWTKSFPGEKFGDKQQLFDQANFFNKDTGIVSGYISAQSGRKNVIYRTIDGGVNWLEVNFGQDGWVDNAAHIHGGEAWLCVAGSGIAYSNDYGRSWAKRLFPDARQRYTEIYVSESHQGLIGSLWNALAYTPDNFCTWMVLPTPLDQKKYQKTNTSVRPAFNRVAIYKNYYLVKQEELVFCSLRDSVNWVLLPDYADFFTDAANSALYFLDKKNRYCLADESLQPIHTSEPMDQPYDAECQKGNLYMLYTAGAVVLHPDNSFNRSAYIQQPDDIQPQTFAYSTDGCYGLQQNTVFRKDYSGGEWTQLYSLPYASLRGSISLGDKHQLIYQRNDDSLFYFDSTGRLINSESKLSLVEGFCQSPVTAVTFGRGSRGCFHNYSYSVKYISQGGTYELEEDGSDVQKYPNAPEQLNGFAVRNFTASVPLLFDPSHRSTISDLEFTDKDYAQCKQDILDFQRSIGKKKRKEPAFSFSLNNIDFTRLLSLVDSIPGIDSVTLNEALLNLSTMWSTTTNWISIELTNEKNQKLSIISSFYQSNAFYCPWMVNLNGISTQTTSTDIYRFVRRVFPEFLTDNNKVAILHTLVKRLYQK